MVNLIEARSPQEIKAAADLFREYNTFLNVDLCFQGFEQELASLPGKYAPPKGEIILAEYQNEIVGCVAVRPFEGNICEMKRLYVKPKAQGLKIGKLLTEAIIKKSKALGYQSIQLDTLEKLEVALKMYEKMGFKTMKPYYENPLEQVVYLTLNLDQ